MSGFAQFVFEMKLYAIQEWRAARLPLANFCHAFSVKRWRRR
jgi:hypothetical protein